MANPTNPFSWQMPTSSDLVTDLPADFEVFGQAVATSMADLLGGTTGQILAKASNTNMDFTWVTNDVGDITEVTASSPLTGGGTSGAITVGIQDATTSVKGAVQLTDSTSSTSTTTAATPNSVKSAFDLANAAVAKSIVDAKGDLIAATAADTVSRLAVGTNDQVLTADSAEATGMKWATPTTGGLTLLNTGGTTLSGSSTSISITTTGYKYLQVFMENIYAAASGNQMTMRINGDTGSNYAFGIIRNTAGSVSAISNTTASDLAYLIPEVTTSTTEQLKGGVSIQINDPAGTDNHQVFWNGYSGGTNVSGSGVYNASAAITAISFGMGGGTTFSGGTVFVYGVK